MKTRYHLLLAVLLSISCTTVYLPNAAQTAFHEDEGDVNLSAFTGTTGYDGQVSYAVTDHWFAAAGGSYMDRDSSREEERNYIRQSYYEGGFGYYTKFSSRGRFSLMGGIGRGNVETIAIYHFFSNHEVPGEGTFHKYFAQVTAGMTSRAVDVGGNIRINYVEYQSLRIRDETFKRVNNSFVEPTFFLRTGWKNIHYHLQTSLIIGLKKDSPFDYEWLRISMGISYRFNLFREADESGK